MFFIEFKKREKQMADEIFENSRLVAIYDCFDGDRRDLEHYVSIVKELKAKSVIDVGCGTGCFAVRLAVEGIQVTAVDPARESIELARRKPNASKVRWILGDTAQLSGISADLVVMTGNVAQVFVSDESWEETLKTFREVLTPQGHFVFEVRNPSMKAWLSWTREKTFKRVDVPNIGSVEAWCEVTNVSEDLVSFRWTYVFASGQETITSDSTLRFRSRDEIERSLETAGYKIVDVRDAPDRPGLEFVFIASRA
jgi:ubiquinone/menaquinone biosynthesis C-methylase UbiE